VRLVAPKKKKRPYNFGFVTFHTKEGVEAALKLNNTEFAGNTLSCQLASKGKKTKVEKEGQDAKGEKANGAKANEEGKGGQSAKAEKRKVDKVVGKAAEPESKRVKGDQDSKGESLTAADSALTLQIRGLPRSLDEILRKDFGRFGEIDKLVVKPNGSAVIKYKVREGCVAASKFASRDYLGRTIQIRQGDGVERAEGKKEKGADGKDKDVSESGSKNKRDSKGKGKGKDGKGSKGKGKNGKDKRDDKNDKGKGKGGKGKEKKVKDEDQKVVKEEVKSNEEDQKACGAVEAKVENEEVGGSAESESAGTCATAEPSNEMNTCKEEPVTDDE